MSASKAACRLSGRLQEKDAPLNIPPENGSVFILRKLERPEPESDGAEGPQQGDAGWALPLPGQQLSFEHLFREAHQGHHSNGE